MVRHVSRCNHSPDSFSRPALPARLPLSHRQAGSALRKAHFYRRVPKELTEGSALGGVVSLVGILVSVSLVYSNAAA